MYTFQPRSCTHHANRTQFSLAHMTSICVWFSLVPDVIGIFVVRCHSLLHSQISTIRYLSRKHVPSINLFFAIVSLLRTHNVATHKMVTMPLCGLVCAYELSFGWCARRRMSASWERNGNGIHIFRSLQILHWCRCPPATATIWLTPCIRYTVTTMRWQSRPLYNRNGTRTMKYQTFAHRISVFSQNDTYIQISCGMCVAVTTTPTLLTTRMCWDIFSAGTHTCSPFSNRPHPRISAPARNRWKNDAGMQTSDSTLDENGKNSCALLIFCAFIFPFNTEHLSWGRCILICFCLMTVTFLVVLLPCAKNLRARSLLQYND